MTTRRPSILVNVTKLFDLAILALSFYLATALVAWGAPSSLFARRALRVQVEDFVLFASFLLLGHIIFMSVGLYGSKRLSSRSAEMRDVRNATAMVSVALLSAAILLHIELVTPPFVLLFFVASYAMTAGSRILIRRLLGRRQGGTLRHLLAAGTNPRAVRKIL